jgi:hypothetical protein
MAPVEAPPPPAQIVDYSGPQNVSTYLDLTWEGRHRCYKRRWREEGDKLFFLHKPTGFYIEKEAYDPNWLGKKLRVQQASAGEYRWWLRKE